MRVPLTLVAELRRRPVDLLHVQYTAPPFTRCPVVATIHDLSFEHLPETFNLRSRLQLRLTVRQTARRAAHVLTSSEYSRNQITTTYGIPKDRVSVTPLAVASTFAPVSDVAELERVRARYAIQGDYLLAVGSLQPRKNLVRLINAYADLCRQRGVSATLPKLVLVGKRGWLYNDIFRAAEASSGVVGSHIVFTGYVPEVDLAALYSGAMCFIYPSFYEGFGLPPLEAMQCGVPVIVGDRTSLPEVVGEAGLMIDPFDQEAMAACIARVIDDACLRDELRARGLERARQFTWAETARQTLRVYKAVFESARSAERHVKVGPVISRSDMNRRD
ncbi:MAG: glycosyltransferase family 1 protein [Pyrinomonadaceae bacterium]